MATIEHVKPFEPGKARLDLEQYATDANAAVELGFIAGFVHDDLRDQLVLDLGTGTGRLAITACYFGARQVIGIEIDTGAARLAVDNARAFGFGERVHVIIADVRQLDSLLCLQGKCTVVMNPPFGIQGPRGADLAFLDVAMAIPAATVIYSMHLSSEKSRTYIQEHVCRAGWQVDELRQVPVILPWLYDFHVEKRKEIAVDVYRVVRQPSTGSP